jgi:4-hydroxy-3-methylbut-2-enyl diphosphate reductase IspH
MTVESPKDFTMLYEENEINILENASEIDKLTMKTPGGVKTLNQTTYENILDKFKEKYKALETVYFFHNNKISEGIIRKVSVEIVFNGESVLLKEQAQIVMTDGTILNSPGELNNFFYTRDELVNYDFN